MMPLQFNVVLKYCEALDEFVKVRVFADREVHSLLRVTHIDSKRAYRQLVVNACVVRYHEDALPALRRRAERSGTNPDSEVLEEQLYALCIEVNPKLDIRDVTLPCAAPTSDDQALHLIDESEVPKEVPLAEDPSVESLGRLRDLELRLRAQVVGQDQAVNLLARAVKKAALGLRDPRRPIGAFLFVGQTGVGKTELAKALTQCIHGDARHLVRVDCSEYSQPHEYAKLIGAPPGYIGHNEGGHLTERVKELGQCVVLFDEIEKAHTKIHNVLLQILDEGIVTDSKGAAIPFQHAVIILTSNLGVDEIERFKNRMGFANDSTGGVPWDVTEQATRASLKENFRPEFLNRIDDVVVFRPLSAAHCVRIAARMLRHVAETFERRGIELEYSRDVVRFIGQSGFSADYGARELRRTITRLVENPLLELVLSGRIVRGSHVRVIVRRDAPDFVVN
ncbi:MAG: ATP-dependent Clp protease ATP-binding subunit [Planctomycetes bacterium]|nr:ATP-dependent Clp protease ATP-binding subunit [Planctomycetota bacterium]